MHQLYWGDLHNHCSISYGHGSVDQALARARQQLDFCSITGHAFWPDMPTDRARYAEIIDYHTEGFARLARNWSKLLEKQQAATEPGKFIALPSYEWHSLEFGDHNVYAPGPELQLIGGKDLPALRDQARAQNAIIIPHHIGYAAGYRGINWRHFQAERSPFVEIYSLHGCSESEQAPYPMLHDMGPRDAGSSAEAGWDQGHCFGVIGSTDHHSAYPGSHGDGRIGVFAKELTREAIWEALLARRVYAATGDRIDARLRINDAWLGEQIKAPGRRRIQVSVAGSDALERVELIKNGAILQRFFADGEEVRSGASRYRLRLAWGWGRKEETVRWNARLALTGGTITQVETCFSGPPVVAPVVQEGDAEIRDEEDLPHALIESSDKEIAWRSITTGNLSMRHATTQALSLEIEAREDARFVLEVNGQRFEHSLPELRAGGRCHYLRGWLTEAVRIGPAVPIEVCQLEVELDDKPDRDVDIYRLRVAQQNGQWAWLTPIWARTGEPGV